MFLLRIKIKAADLSIFLKFRVKFVSYSKEKMTRVKFVDKYFLEDQSLDFLVKH